MPKPNNKDNKALTLFNEEQLGVVKAAIFGAIATLILAYLLYKILPLPIPSLETKLDKIVYAARCLVFPMLTMFAGIVTVANSRFFSQAINPLINAETDRQKVHIKYLNNTHEQLFLFTFTTIVLSTFLEGESIRFIPILCLIFTIARIIFWVGYLQAPVKRGLGMIITEIAVFAPLIYTVYLVIKELIL